MTIDGSRRFQRIDGFGVNVTPAQWRGGHLRGALDRLVDDLGVTLVRFDAFGKADWLDPARRRDGRFDPDHLREVYTRQDFRDAWETFRYLNSKGLQPFWSVSGGIPAAWAGPDGQTLVDYDAYADMVVSELRWAREQEHLDFTRLSPFNETDLGFPEGPKLAPAAIVPATAAIVRALDRAGLSDVRLIVADDASVGFGYIDALLAEPSLAPRVEAFGTHWYGDGNEGDAEPWSEGTRPFASAAARIAAHPAWAGHPLWITGVRGPRPEWGGGVRRRLAVHAPAAEAAVGRRHRRDGLGRVRQLPRARRRVGDLRPAEDRPRHVDVRAEAALFRGEAGLPLRAIRLRPGRGDRRRPEPDGRIRSVPRHRCVTSGSRRSPQPTDAS